MMRLCIVAGARPNFMKVAAIISAVETSNMGKATDRKMEYLVVHTGQHYDAKMSKIFFDDLGIPVPDINLEVGSASHAVQTAEIMKKFEEVCLREKPTHILVVGDVNSTIACALVAAKLSIKVIHVEAGLRSFDRTMPEEINRLLTDAISDILFTSEESGNENLIREGVDRGKIHFVGNVMIDTLLRSKKRAMESDILNRLGILAGGDESVVQPYSLLTLHRPSNVDDAGVLENIILALGEIAREIPMIFPVHPRTLKTITKERYEDSFAWNGGFPAANNARGTKIHCIEPLGYLDFLKLMSGARVVLTDSGGIQEETTILGVPCVTIRENTERPVTVTEGTNIIAGAKRENIVKAAFSQMGRKLEPMMPPLWDGKAAERILEVLSHEI